MVGSAAALLLPTAAASAASPALTTLFDHALQAWPDYPEMLRRLAAGGIADTGSDAAILRMVVRGLERAAALETAFPYGKRLGASPYVISHRHGVWLEIEDGPGDPAFRFHPLEMEAERLRAEAARGIVPPLFMLDAAREGLRARYPTNAPAAVARELDVLASLRARAPREPGVWQFPGGPGYYALRLRCTTGTDLTPLGLDRLVRAEIAALTRRADALLERLGLSRGSVGARLRALKQRPEHLYANDDAGRARAVADMNAVLDRVRPRLAAWFNPPIEAGAHVTRMRAADETAGKRGYRDPATGTYYPDLADARERPGWTLATVACHETIPGHMLQLRREAVAKPHALQARYAVGYEEGWAIYAESLADRMGIFTPVEQIGFLQSWLFRLARVAADIGIHVHRWSRARAVAYLTETVGFELFFPFAVEVDRYAAEPAGFAGDAVAALTLAELAKRRTGPAAMRAFHDAVLNRGPLSVEALRAVT